MRAGQTRCPESSHRKPVPLPSGVSTDMAGRPVRGSVESNTLTTAGALSSNTLMTAFSLWHLSAAAVMLLRSMLLLQGRPV